MSRCGIGCKCFFTLNCPLRLHCGIVHDVLEQERNELTRCFLNQMANEFIALARMLWCFDIRPKKGIEYDVWDYVGMFCTITLIPSILAMFSQKIQHDMLTKIRRWLQRPAQAFRLHHTNPQSTTRSHTEEGTQ